MYICGFFSIFQDALEVCLQKKLPLALARGKIKLVVIDSVAALFRCHYDNKNLVVRAKHLASLATQLRQLADRYNTAVICVNQVRQLCICLPVFVFAVTAKHLAYLAIQTWLLQTEQYIVVAVSVYQIRLLF